MQRMQTNHPALTPNDCQKSRKLVQLTEEKKIKDEMLSQNTHTAQINHINAEDLICLLTKLRMIRLPQRSKCIFWFAVSMRRVRSMRDHAVVRLAFAKVIISGYAGSTKR